MALGRDFEWLQNETNNWLNFNPNQTDQSYTTAQIKSAVNNSYIDEVNQARQHGSPKYFRTSEDVTWSSGNTTYTVPDYIAAASIEEIQDVTDSDPGYRLIFDENGRSGNLFWKSGVQGIIQWGESGPPSDKTLRIYYIAEPAEMLDDGDEPALVPPSYRRLIALSAAISLREMADETAPPAWLVRRQDYRFDYWKHVRLGRPRTDVPTIVGDNSDVDVGYVF